MKTIRVVLLVLSALPCMAQDSLNVARVGQIAYWDTPEDVAVQGTMAYVAARSSGLRIIDLTDATSPVELGFCHLTDSLNGMSYMDSSRAVAVASNYAYVIGDFGHLHVVDISNPQAPFEVALFDSADDYSLGMVAQAISVSGSYAYMADSEQGLRVIDISAPASPRQVGRFALPGQVGATDVAIDGSHAYLACNDSVRIIDISDPTAPEELGAYHATGAVAAAGNFIYLSLWDSLRVLDVSDPAAPLFVGQLRLRGYDVTVAGNYAYVSDFDTLHVIDVSNPAAPTVAGVWASTSYYGTRIAVQGEEAITVGWGLDVLDISNPVAPVQVGTYEMPPGGWAWDVAVSDGFAYVASAGGLRVIDVSNPANPQQVALAGTHGWCEDVTVSGDFAYAVSFSGGLTILNVSSPSSPVEVGRNDSIDDASSVAVQGNYAYVTQYGEGLHVVDISNPAQPTHVGFSMTGGHFRDVAVAGNYAYAVGEYGGALRIIDISNPASPVPVGFFPAPLGRGVAVSGTHAYLADGDKLRILDISVPSSPVQIDSMVLPGWCNRVKVEGNYAFMANGTGGIRVIDISDPAAPFETGYYISNCSPFGVAASGHYIYSAETIYFGVYDCSAALSARPQLTIVPDQFALYPAYPNPFNSITTLQLDLPRAVNVRLAVYDVLGRKAATLVDGMMNAGTYALHFDAGDLASGVYVVKLDAGDVVRSEKVMLIK